MNFDKYDMEDSMKVIPMAMQPKVIQISDLNLTHGGDMSKFLFSCDSRGLSMVQFLTTQTYCLS